MADPINTLLANIKSDLLEEKGEGGLKDGNRNVANIWDSLDWANPTPHHLPMVQFGELETSAGAYVGDGLQTIPFSIQVIAWVDGKQGNKADEARAREFREKVIISLHNKRPFSRSGGTRQTIRIARQRNLFIFNRFAIGMGVTYSADLWKVAGD